MHTQTRACLHLYKSMPHRQGSRVKAYVYVCIYVRVSLHVSYSANEVISNSDLMAAV